MQNLTSQKKGLHHTTFPPAVSSVQENLLNAELYAKYRKQMRKDEQELRNLRYKIEDEILAESNGTEVSNEQ